MSRRKRYTRNVGRTLAAPLPLDAPEDADNERFWFRGEAREHATRARRMAELVRQAGFPIVEL